MNLLGIDIGTGGSRAVVIDGRGRIAASATESHRDFASPRIGWAEQDPADWWRAASAAIRAVLGAVNAREIAAVGLSGQMHGSVLLDRADNVLRPALLWCDQRTEPQCGAIERTVGTRRLIQLVCNPAVTGFTLPKLLWVRENEPEVWDKTRSVLLPKDYVRLRLSGEKASDVADSSGTLLFDVKNRRWSESMLAEFGIEPELMPRVFESSEITGAVTARAAAETGLRAGTPIVAGAGDNAAGAIGMGITRAGTVSVTIGTSGVVFGVTESPKLDPQGRIHTLCHAIPERWHNTGVTLAAGLSLKWFRDTFAVDNSFDALSAEASAVRYGSEGLVWLPYLMGERTPHRDANARGAFVGLTASHTRAHLTRAVMEGVAFSLRDSLEIFKECGAGISSIRLGGGGAKSPLWRQIQADVYGQAVSIAEADEGAAFGAAILAGVGAGAWGSVDEACDAAVRIAETIEPDRETAGRLEQNYEVFRMLYPALRPVYELLRINRRDR